MPVFIIFWVFHRGKQRPLILCFLSVWILRKKFLELGTLATIWQNGWRKDNMLSQKKKNFYPIAFYFLFIVLWQHFINWSFVLVPSYQMIILIILTTHNSTLIYYVELECHTIIYPLVYSKILCIIYVWLEGVFLMAHWVKNLPAIQEMRVQSLGWKDPLEKDMATHSSILAWEILWTEEPGGLQSMESQSKMRLSTAHRMWLQNKAKIIIY